jgi:cytochrome c2
MKTKFKLLAFIFSAFLNIFFVYSTMVNKHFPYYELAVSYRTAESYLKSLFLKEENFIDNIRDTQNTKKTDYKEEVKFIESNLLPLKITHKSLSSKKFAQTGGAISVVNDDIILMDRLGYFFIYNKNLLSTNISVNNNISNFLKNYEGDRFLSTTTLRAHKITFDKQSNMLYASYTRFIDTNKIKLVVSAINYDDFISDNNNWTDIWLSNEFLDVAHNTHAGGGSIAILDNFLYVSIGYSEDETGIKTINSGKIFKVNLDTGQATIFSSGHRNVQGMTTINNLIYATEHGPQGGDELNIIYEGLDYGWPNHSFGTKYGSYDNYLDNPNGIKFELPIFSYVPSIGISSVIGSSSFHPFWKNNLIIGSLKSMTLKRLLYDDNKIILEEDIFLGNRIRDIAEKANKIIILNDNAELIFMEVDSNNLNMNSKNNNLSNSDIFIKKCTICHNLSKNGPNVFGPHLYELKNRKIGNTDYKNYSKAILDFNDVWNSNNLEKYLSNPNDYIKGTSMPNLGLSDNEIKEIINYLIN